MKERLQKVTSWLHKEKLDFALVTSTANIFYLTQFYCDPHERLFGLLLFPDREPILICPAMEKELARAAGWSKDILGHHDTDQPWKMVAAALERNGVTNPKIAAIEKEHLSFERAEQLTSLFPSLSFRSMEEKMHHLRMVKSTEEISIMLEAAQLADYGVQVGMDALYEGCTEMEIVATIEYALKRKGVSQMSFSTLVLFGANSGAPHGNPGLNQLRRGDLVLFDLGVVWKGYCSDITRTCGFYSLDTKERQMYEAVQQAQESALQACRPGVQLSELDRIARTTISEAGWGEYFPHRLGHGLGIDVHEQPYVHDLNSLVLEPGMVFTIEPGVYVPGVGGVRIEDDVVVTEDGARSLTSFSKELLLVEAKSEE
ncbi:Xaa-Pro peptidase family protein [Mechercharimyces sp. CAU 1602]|uniref:M24 family metallopeptidase n=1 Tax=Mechercharimyces sp. CAU 1602 TaxID=2973933 RepID=UPI002162D36A|nr:Xaa-Pro peptidase family protein [Mechercharimyces sp. CAU 1602]MCS1351863.1 Xaa-Pro peptidase family protein [Mechercharimyces sp. CAU 1602]